MPFGCSISCQKLELFLTFLEICVTRQADVGRLLHYLHDFLFGGKKETNQCAYIMSAFHGKMALLAVPVSSDKTEGPKTNICFLGLEIDSEEMLIRIPATKISEITKQIEAILTQANTYTKKRCSL